MGTTLQWSYEGLENSNPGSNAAAYSDFKTALAQTGFRGDIFYKDVSGIFSVFAVDYIRTYIHTLSLNNTTGSQKPSTFGTDFPAAIAVGANGAIFSISTST